MIARRWLPDLAASVPLARWLERAAAVLALGLYVAIVTQGAWTSLVPVPARWIEAALALGLAVLLTLRAGLSALVRDSLPRHRETLLVVLLLAGGAVLRLAAALLAGAPTPAEAAVVQEATRIITTGDYRLEHLGVPPLLAYFHAAVAAVRYLQGVNTGLYNRITQVDAADFFGWAGAAASLLGAVAPALIYAAGRQLFGTRAALLALALAAGSFVAIQSGRAIDGQAGSILMLSAGLAAAAWVGHAPKRAAMAIGCAGLVSGIALTFTAAGWGTLLASLVAISLLPGSAEPRLARWAEFVCLFVAGFVIANPYAVLEYHRFLDAVAAGAHPFVLADLGPRLIGHQVLGLLTTSLRLEPLATIAAVGGAALVIRRHGRADRILLAYLLPCLILASLYQGPATSALAWFVPPLVLLAGQGLDAATARTPWGRKGWRWLTPGRAAFLGTAVVLCASALARWQAT